MLMAGQRGPGVCCRTFSRIFGAPQSGYSRFRRTIGLAERAPAAIGQPQRAATLVPVVQLVAGLARNPELHAQRRHLPAVEQARDKPKPLVHDVTLLPRHAPSPRRVDSRRPPEPLREIIGGSPFVVGEE